MIKFYHNINNVSLFSHSNKQMSYSYDNHDGDKETTDSGYGGNVLALGPPHD